MRRNHHQFLIVLSLALLMSALWPLNAVAAALRGDVNGDGKVTIADVTSLINGLLVGNAGGLGDVADVNADGTVNIADVTALINHLLSGSELLPIAADPEEFTVGGVSFYMIPVEGGSFMMGATAEQGSDAIDREKPVHQVTLSSFYIGQTEVTQALWQAVTGEAPSYFNGGDLPVEQVSWEDCQAFIAALNGLTGRQFRLPTEAEWASRVLETTLNNFERLEVNRYKLAVYSFLTL